MATAGQTSEPTYGDAYSSGSTWNQVASLITLPDAGTIDSLHVYFGGRGGSASARLCVWSETGALLYQSGLLSAGAGNGWRSVSGVGLRHSAGQRVRVGFWCSSADPRQWTYASSGGHRRHSGADAPEPLGGSEYSGAIGAYVTYTPGTSGTEPAPAPADGALMRVKVNGAMTRLTLRAKVSGEWKLLRFRIRVSGAWKP